MKKLLISAVLLAVISVTGYSQTPPTPPVGVIGVGNAISEHLAKVDESENLFDDQEISVKLGAVYVQKTSEAAASLSVTKYIKSGFGIGGEVIESDTTGTAAVFAFAEYRRSLGNVAGSVIVGGGYDEQNKTPMGVVALRMEYRLSKRIGTYVSAGWGIENVKTKRGLVTGGGLSYAF